MEVLQPSSPMAGRLVTTTRHGSASLRRVSRRVISTGHAGHLARRTCLASAIPEAASTEEQDEDEDDDDQLGGGHGSSNALG
jgi:hypothetical protein